MPNPSPPAPPHHIIHPEYWRGVGGRQVDARQEPHAITTIRRKGEMSAHFVDVRSVRCAEWRVRCAFVCAEPSCGAGLRCALRASCGAEGAPCVGASVRRAEPGVCREERVL